MLLVRELKQSQHATHSAKPFCEQPKTHLAFIHCSSVDNNDQFSFLSASDAFVMRRFHHIIHLERSLLRASRACHHHMRSRSNKS